MFHFLVKYDGWTRARDSIQEDRVFEYTDAAISEQFAPGGSLDVDLVTTLPALFASEINGTGKQEARVGSITRTQVSGDKINIEYGFDDGILPISNLTLQKLSRELDIGSWELSRTHWAVKNVDLLMVLLRNQVATLPSPKVFKLDSVEGVDDSLVSVMMPFDPRFDDAYTAVQASVTALNMRCLRADDIWVNDAIVQDIVSLINRSRVIVCDCTGRNPNVFYEVGIAHTLGRDVILITQSEADIPFDLRHLRYVTYLNNGEGRQALGERLRQRIQTIIEQASRNG
jgi:hypothetical protein